MNPTAKTSSNNQGFTIVELVIACALFPMIVIGIANAYNAVRLAYMNARQLNQIYAVLSACPELDRALDYNSLTSTANCYPNNSFQAENGSTTTITYTPTLTITNTSSLSVLDPLHDVPDSKIVEVNVSMLKPFQNTPPIKLKILVTRNGIGQL